jgi:synaptobrevin family protein YKT6
LGNKSISDIFLKYQDPTKVDKLTEAIQEVEETKIVLHESVRKLLEQQGDLDELVSKSKDLSEASKQFYKNSKKMNKSCCQMI